MRTQNNIYIYIYITAVQCGSDIENLTCFRVLHNIQFIWVKYEYILYSKENTTYIYN